MTNHKDLNLREELSKFKLASGYMRTKEDHKKESWEEAVGRVTMMHYMKYSDVLSEKPELIKLLSQAEAAYSQGLILGSQRGLQFGGDPIFKHNTKIYNCATTYCDRPEVFREILYVLLCGAGAGISVQFHHVNKLPTAKRRTGETKTFVIGDSIEGWADALGALMASFFRADEKFAEYYGCPIRFDYSKVRPEGSYISGGFKAPGPKGLQNSLEKCEGLLESLFADDLTIEVKLKPIHCYDIICHSSDAVLSGGVRRSALLIMFSKNDEDMLSAKIGNWFVTNKQRARSNNSCALLRSETTWEEFDYIYQRTKQFGEPGFIWVDSLEHLYNPCVEAGMRPKLVLDKDSLVEYNGRKFMTSEVISKVEAGEEVELSGWQFCNLNEINGGACTTEEKFYEACEAAAILGSFQAGYTDFTPYLTDVTTAIVEREALLGVSITGMCNNPDVLFNPEIQKKGALIVVETNKKVAALLGIKPAARCTNVKPSGNSSVILGCASGISGEHSKMFFRNIQANKNETLAKALREVNPLMFEQSVWSANGNDWVISFPVIVPEGSLLKADLLGVKQLELVRLTQQNWVEYGTNYDATVDPLLKHNVSNTINVDDWEEVEKYIYDNRNYFAGISLLSQSGDKDYAQAPFTSVYTPKQMLKEYGDASLYASGLIEHALQAFSNNLWMACDTAMGFGMKLEYTTDEVIAELNKLTVQEAWERLGIKGKALKVLVKTEEKPSVDEYKTYMDEKLHEQMFNASHMIAWVKRIKKFAKNYFNGDLKKATYCIKDVHNYNRWKKVIMNYTPLDYDDVEWEMEFVDASTLGAQACGGAGCDIL